MNRRTLLMAAGAGIGGLGLVGYGASETGVLTDSPPDTSPTVTAPGEFYYGVYGVDTVAWLRGSDRSPELAITFQSTPPDAFRLHYPDGRRVWAGSELSGGETITKPFRVPIEHRGTWELVVQNGGSYDSLQIPVGPTLEINGFGLQGEDVVASVDNPSNAPQYLMEIELTHGNTGVYKEYSVGQVLMPSEGYTFSTPYPFDYYKDVTLFAWASGSLPGVEQTKSFV